MEGGSLSTRTGIASGTDRSIISGIDTTGIEPFDVISDGGVFISQNPPTVITAVGMGTISISEEHGIFSGSSILTLSVFQESFILDKMEIV